MKILLLILIVLSFCAEVFGLAWICSWIQLPAEKWWHAPVFVLSILGTTATFLSGIYVVTSDFK